MRLLGELLQVRSPVVYPFGPDQTVVEAVTVMAENGIGAVPVVDRGKLVGIFSERDLLRRVIGRGRAPEKTLLREVMTPQPVTATPRETREDAIRKMQAVGCRHLPIVTDELIIDMLSMRDLLFVKIAENEAEIDALKQYIQGSR